MQKEKQPTFVIRKLTIGAASVLVGLSFFGAKNQIVHADTVSADQNTQANAVQTQNSQTQNQNDVVRSVKTNHTQINYQDQNDQSIAPSKNIDTEYQGYYKKAQGQVTYHDDTTSQDIGNSQVSGYVGQKPDLTKSYTDKGYDVVSNNQNRLSQNSQDNNYTVHLKHHIDSQVTNTQKATNTINYVDNQNNKLADSKTQSCSFQTRKDTDRVTGKTTTVLSQNQHVFSGIKNPVIHGYITNNAKSRSTVVTPTDLNKQENVVYNKLGKFIMTDTDNNIIGVQTYQNDDQNASQVINLAPDINGYKLTSKFNTILDPTENTTLIYQKINQANPSNPDNPNKTDQDKPNTNPNNPNNPNTGNSGATNPSNPDNPNKGNSGVTNPSNPDNPNKPDQPDNPSANPNNPNKGNSSVTNPSNPDSSQPNPDNPNKDDSSMTNPTKPDNPNKGDSSVANPSNPDNPNKGNTDDNHPNKPNANPNNPNKSNSGVTNPTKPDNPNKGNTDDNHPNKPNANPNNPNKGNSGVTNPSNPDNPNKGNSGVTNPSSSDNPNKGNTDDNQPDKPNTNPDNPNKDNSGVTNPSNPANPNKGNTDDNQTDNPSTNPDNPNKSNSDKDNPNKDNTSTTNPDQPNNPSTKPDQPNNPDNPNKTDHDKPSKPDSGKTDQNKPSDPAKPDDSKSQTAKPGDVVKPNDPHNNKADNTDNGKVKLIINDVDETGHILLNSATNKPYTQEYDQTLKDGQDDANYNVTFNPVIPGYITDNSENDDIVITRKMGQKTINIKYRKLGQYIFKDKDGNTIKDPMTYSNMNDDPTQADELDDMPIIPGYELEENQSVAIDDPTKDTTLIYDKLPDSTITLDFIDETNDQQIGQKVLTGKVYSVSDAMSQMQLAAADYESQGYVLDSSDLQYDPTFSQNPQTYKTYFKHNTKRSLKEKRYTHRTIHFIDKLTGKPMQADAVQTAEWKKYQVTDSVTGVTTAENTWQVNTDESKYQHYGDDQYESFKVPFYNGWRTDESVIQSVDLPSTPDDLDANKEITIYYTQNGHFRIHMIKAKQTVVGYTTYTDSNGNTYTVRDPSKDRYEFVEDTGNSLNQENVTYTNDRQSYQTIEGDIPVPGEGETDEKGDSTDPQRKTDGKDIKTTHELNGGEAIDDLVPDNKQYVLHAEEYQKHIVPKKYFTGYRLKVVKGPDGMLHEEDGNPYTTGWPYRHHSDGNQDRQMDQFYASQNLDVYYRPYAVNGHKIDKHGNVGGGEFGKVVNFNVKKYNPADYCGYDTWSNDGSEKLATPLIAKDGSWSDPDSGHDSEIVNEDENVDFTDSDSDVPITPDYNKNSDPDKDYHPDDGNLDNNQNDIDTSTPHYGDNDKDDPDPWGKNIPDDSDDENLNGDDSDNSNSNIIIDDPNVTRDETNTTIHLHKNHKTPNATSKNTHIKGTYRKTSRVQVAVANAKNSVNIDAPIMFYRVLVNGQEVARDLTKDQLENYTVNVNSPIINGETPDQSTIKLSYNDPENSTVIVKYTKADQTKPDNPDTPNKDGTDNLSKPDSGKTKPNNPNKSDSNKDNPANPNKGNTDNSSKPLAPVNQDQPNQGQTKPNKPDTNNQDNPTNPAKGSNKSDSNSQTSPIMPSNPNGSSQANPSKSDSNSQTSLITPSNPNNDNMANSAQPSNPANLTNPNNTNSDQNDSQTGTFGKHNNNAKNNKKNHADNKSIKKNKSSKSKSENVRTKKKTNNVHHKTAGSTPSNTNIHRIYTGDKKLIHKKFAKSSKLDLSRSAEHANTVADPKQSTSKLTRLNAVRYASRGVSAGSNSYTAAVNTNNAQTQNARASNLASNSAISRYTRSNSMSAMTMPVAQVKLQHAQNSVQSINNQSNSTLPQTGRANYNMALPAIGLAMLVNAGLFGLAKTHKHNS